MNSEPGRDPRARIDPQLSAALARAAEITAELGPPLPGPQGAREHAARGRLWWNEGGPELAEAREDRIPGPIRDIPVMVYRPALEKPLPVFVYLHGGGYRVGNHKSNDRQMRELAAAWGGAVVSADYAHVPEHSFPTAVEETVAVYQWINANGAAWGLDGARLAFGGGSAGANVAFGAAVALRGVESGFLKAGVGIVGVFDQDGETHSMRLYGQGDFKPNREGVAAIAVDYAPNPADRGDPRVNIVAADPQLFPPVFLAAAEVDCLRDSSSNLATLLKAAGRPHQLQVYPGMTHFFFGFSRTVDMAARAIRDIAAFLRTELPA